MKKATGPIKFIFSFFLAFFLSFNTYFPVFAQGIFNLSYTLTEGGNRLELSPDNQYKGVRISINSGVSVRYQITQRIIDPLQSRETSNLSFQDNFVFRGIGGTNRFGDMRSSTGDTPVRQDDILYVSDNAGDSDSFTLVYGLARLEDIAAGDYFGRIGYTLTPIGSAIQSQTQILEVHINIPQENSAKPRIEITTPTGSRQIVLNSKREDTKSASVLIKINGKFTRQFSIKQILRQGIESLEGEKLNDEAVKFMVKDTAKGISANQLRPLSLGLQNLYSSASNGDTDNQLVVNYSLGDLSKQKAGKYRARLQYVLEEMGVESNLDTVELDVENDPIFDLAIIPQDQKYAIEFRDLKPLGPPKRNEIVIEIKTNRGKKYQVTQELYSDLRSKEGEAIPNKYFTFQAQGFDTKGKLNFTEKKEVKNGNNILFISDDLGSSDKFKVTYELSCPEQLKAGDYSTSVTYSLLEM